MDDPAVWFVPPAAALEGGAPLADVLGELDVTDGLDVLDPPVDAPDVDVLDEGVTG